MENVEIAAMEVAVNGMDLVEMMPIGDQVALSVEIMMTSLDGLVTTIVCIAIYISTR
jgi:hypothetical protein